MALLLNQGDEVSRSYSYTKPSPTHPIMPEFVGVRTGNLCPVTSFDKPTDRYYVISLSSPLQPGTYTLSAEITGESLESRISFRNSSLAQITGVNIAVQSGRSAVTVTLNNTCYALYIYGGTAPTDIIPISYENIMLNAGSTALHYAPYGWTEKITSAGQTVPVFLGEVPTVRRVKKLVLDGTEVGWTKASSARVFYNTSIVDDANNAVGIVTVLSSHYDAQINVSTVGNVNDKHCCFRTSAKTIYIADSNFEAISEFVEYLAAQYAAGTPVTVWYVLAEPETAIVNEPLCKIGDYADTLTSEQAGVILPTNDGNTTISVDTALAPSKFEVKVHAKAITP
jgi:hypothetical protein